MIAQPKERLYRLLPAVYRIRDLAQGEQLRALLGVIEEEVRRIEGDIAGLYDNWFIETCAEWAVPYLGDLVDSRLLHSVSQRAFTANTLAYRRRKGTLQTLAALARDVTGWTARGVEYMQLLATAQHINSVRPNNIVIPSLSRLDELENIGTPFEKTSRTVSIKQSGRYHRDQVGLFVWRLGSYLLERVRAVPAEHGGGFYMNPLGFSSAIWGPGSSRPGLTVTTEAHSAPQPLHRAVLYRTLEGRRQALVDGLIPQDPYFTGEPMLRVFVPGAVDADGLLAAGAQRQEEVPCEQILIAKLDPWWTPPDRLTYKRSDGTAVEMPIRVALDPERGRIAFPAGQAPAAVWTSYYYGFAAELGGGGYDRESEALPASTRVVTISGGDAGGLLARLADPEDSASLWAGAGGQLCVQFTDSDTYAVGPLRVPAGGRLELRSQRWQRPLLCPAASEGEARWRIRLGQGATLVLDGLAVQGGLTLAGSALGGDDASSAVTGVQVVIRHSTLVPGGSLLPSGLPAAPDSPSIAADASIGAIELRVEKSISGAIDLSAVKAATAAGAPAARAIISDSILDGAGSSKKTLQAALATLARVTVLGSTVATELEETVDTLFCGPVIAPLGSEGGVRYSYLPDGSQLPGPYRCQPAMALSVPGIDVKRTRLLLVPWFVSRRYGTSGYGLLDARCHEAIRNGASVEGELGALQSLQQAQREANLLDCQAEYLRLGITLNLFLVT